ncbi:uncharacterized protein LOC118421882 [Branchiostoma floridae]|uniref:Uncharacterized protein LOC118421882 n=1 Tax=Branchiostoma floridae TaxID=7739 RepID=A0A9J7MYZ5_BRAFL|nr:uncharacterized protein LOC118421882 [Branchiostoma floridae]
MSAGLSYRLLCLAALVSLGGPAMGYLRSGGARKVRRRTCIVDKIPVQEDFNLAKFGGKWYEIARVRHHSFRGHPDIVSTGGAFVFDVKPNGRDASVSYFGKIDGRCQLMIPGRLMATSYDPPAKMTYKFAGFNYPFDEGDLWILDTDYQNYALLYNCLVRNSDGTCRRNMNLAWILSRRPTLSAEMRKKLDQKLYTVCVIPYNRLTNTPHNGDDCSPSLTTSTPVAPTTTVFIPTTTITAVPPTTTAIPTTLEPTTTTTTILATTITMVPTTVSPQTTTERTVEILNEEENSLGSGYMFYRVEDGSESSGFGCQDLDCSISCAGGYREDDYGCEICECRDEVPVEQNRLSRRLPTFCQELTCDLDCRHGYRTDDYDCEVCECLPPSRDHAVAFRAAQAQRPICRPPDCEWMHCDWGLDQDESGCEVCRCREDPDRRCRRTFQAGVSKCFDDFQLTSRRNVQNDPQEYCRAQSGLYRCYGAILFTSGCSQEIMAMHCKRIYLYCISHRAQSGLYRCYGAILFTAQSGLYRCYGAILFTSGCSQEIMASLYEEHIRQGLEYVRRYCQQWVQYARRVGQRFLLPGEDGHLMTLMSHFHKEARS